LVDAYRYAVKSHIGVQMSQGIDNSSSNDGCNGHKK
jgi:hypothetical protein